MVSQTPDWFFQPTDVILYDPADSQPSNGHPLKPFDESIWAEAWDFQQKGETIFEPSHQEVFISLREGIERLPNLLKRFQPLLPQLDEKIRHELTQSKPQFLQLAKQVNRELVLLRTINPLLEGRYGFPSDPLPYQSSGKKRYYRRLVRKIRSTHRKTCQLIKELTKPYGKRQYGPFGRSFYDLHPIFRHIDWEPPNQTYLTTQDPFSFNRWSGDQPGCPDFPSGHDQIISTSDINRMIEMPTGSRLYWLRNDFIALDRISGIRDLYKELESLQNHIRRQHDKIGCLERSLDASLFNARKRRLDRLEHNAETARKKRRDQLQHKENECREACESTYRQHVKEADQHAAERLQELEQKLETLAQASEFRHASKTV